MGFDSNKKIPPLALPADTRTCVPQARTSTTIHACKQRSGLSQTVILSDFLKTQPSQPFGSVLLA